MTPTTTDTGRKYKLARFVLLVGLTYGLACLAAMVYSPTIAQHIASMGGSISLLAGVVVTMFSSANAYISGKAMQTGTDPIPTERA